MTREQLAHLLRAAAQIALDNEVVVFGSQAILASYDETALPDEVIGSIEADVTFFDDVDDAKSDAVDGAIGELSQFHEMYGIYAQGVSLSTAVLGPGWEERLVLYENPETEPGRGRCLEKHDLVAAKLAAGREKDFAFARALLRERLVDKATVVARVESLPIAPERRIRIVTWIDANSY